ncbi:MAG: succinate dehydrogenase assembly factor 2 [Enterobacterales bacterium]
MYFIYKKSKIYWSCRRGILELDLIIIPFFLYYFDKLILTDKISFIKLLNYNDSDLFNVIIKNDYPKDKNLIHIIDLIKNSRKPKFIY